MKVGSFGGTIFEVSNWKLMTFSKLKRKVGHRYIKHDIVNHKPLLESVGAELVELSLEVILHGNLGVDVGTESQKIRKMCTAGEVDYLVIGNEVVSDTKFVIETVDEEVEAFDKTGKPIITKMTLKFKEYVEMSGNVNRGGSASTRDFI